MIMRQLFHLMSYVLCLMSYVSCLTSHYAHLRTITESFFCKNNRLEHKQRINNNFSVYACYFALLLRCKASPQLWQLCIRKRFTTLKCLKRHLFCGAKIIRSYQNNITAPKSGNYSVTITKLQKLLSRFLFLDSKLKNQDSSQILLTASKGYTNSKKQLL